MITCPQCGFDNQNGAIVCLRCYTLLGYKREDSQAQPSTTIASQPANSQPPESTLPQSERPSLIRLDRYSVALYVGSLPLPLILQIVDTAYLGRRSDLIKVYPLLDLTPFEAFGAGVSRLHAAIHRTKQGITLEDLQSSNGTWLNNVRLTPNLPAPLKPGDQLRLSSLPIQIIMADTPSE